jgi:GrpB-like predicted nucleotidyltransferase (UPF0157 family)
LDPLKRIAEGVGMSHSLRPSEEFVTAATAEFERLRSRIARLLPGADVRHIGGTSVQGALTKGDLDIQVRMSPESFAAAVSRLRQIYATANDDLWNAHFAAFTAPRSSLAYPSKISVVAIGSVYDRNGARVWELLAANAALLQRYNDLKFRHAARGQRAYEDAKAAFFRDLASSRDALAQDPSFGSSL